MPHIARERYSELVDAKLRATIVKRVGVICNNLTKAAPRPVLSRCLSATPR